MCYVTWVSVHEEFELGLIIMHIKPILSMRVEVAAQVENSM